MDMVARCIPEEDKKEQTQFTGNAFYYFKRNEISGKVFIVKDLEGALTALFPIRELQSEKKISKTITRKGKDGKLETITLVVEGPVSVITCTTQESIYEDNANRSILIYLDDSKEQDEKVMSYQKLKRAGLIDIYKENEIRNKLQNIQKCLEPIKVINPYAPLIDLPESIKTQRRMLPILLSFIEAITFYHQYQRHPELVSGTGEVYIESTPQDVENGFMYLQDVLFRKSDELNGAVRNFYEKLKIIVERYCDCERSKETTEENQAKKFKVSDIKNYYKLSPRSIQIYFKTLVEYGYLQVVGGKQRTGYEYELLSAPSETELQKEIEKHIKIVLERVQKSYQKRTKKEAIRNNAKQENFAIEQ
jgi:predicted DNA-binding transcriptional regulator